MSEPRHDTWMPIYWGDYARDTGHLNNAGHGAYLMLIKHYWCSGEALADDDGLLWRISCCDGMAAWRKIRPSLERLFNITDGKWRHKRIDRELAKAAEITRKRSEAAKQMHSKRSANAQQTMVQNALQSQPQSQIEVKELVNGLAKSKELNGASAKPNFTEAQTRRQRWQQKVVAYANRTCKPHDLRMWLAVALTDTPEGKLAFERMNDRMRAEEAAAQARAG